MGPLGASTLEKLTLNDMIDKSTSIVHGKVVGNTYTTTKGSTIYTHYTVQVTDRWKGSGSSTVDVVVPGGVAGSERQVFSGAPKLVAGSDYVLFLWTSASGLTHIVGLSQGLLEVKVDANGKSTVVRAASAEEMVDAAGKTVTDSVLTFSLDDLATRVSGRILGK
jgi:hypothetical protein